MAFPPWLLRLRRLLRVLGPAASVTVATTEARAQMLLRISCGHRMNRGQTGRRTRMLYGTKAGALLWDGNGERSGPREITGLRIRCALLVLLWVK